MSNWLRNESDDVRFLDWTVTGVPLRSLLGWAQPTVLTTVVRSGWDLDAVLASLDTFTRAGAGEFPDGRVGVLVCEQCGDLECGALSAEVQIADGVVRWKDFGWQVPSEEGFDAGDLSLEFEFDEIDYRSLMSSVRDRLVTSAGQVEEPSRWPWRKPEIQRVVRI